MVLLNTRAKIRKLRAIARERSELLLDETYKIESQSSNPESGSDDYCSVKRYYLLLHYIMLSLRITSLFYLFIQVHPWQRAERIPTWLS